MGWTCDEDGRSDPAKKVLCTKPGRSGYGRRGTPKLRWCNKLEEDFLWDGCRNWRIKWTVKTELAGTH
jgi:hypothetical protein